MSVSGSFFELSWRFFILFFLKKKRERRGGGDSLYVQVELVPQLASQLVTAQEMVAAFS